MILPQTQPTNLVPSLGSDAAILDGHPGPVLFVGADGDILRHNPPAAALLTALGRITGGLDGLGRLGQTAIAQGQATTVRFAIGEGEARRTYEATAIPAAGFTDVPRALVICRDNTLDENIRLALAESRRRFQDLVNIASDFAWETAAQSDSGGHLVFVSPDGALGYTAAQLVGKDPGTLLAEPDLLSGPLPFLAREPIREQQLWLRNAQGEAICTLISATPISDAAGNWCGARGICRDITEQISLDAQLQSALVREQLTAHLVDQIRTQADPSAMLGAAATALAHAVSATALVCRLAPAGGDAADTVIVMAQSGPAAAMDEIGGPLADFAAGSGEFADLTVASHCLLARKTGYLDQTNGLVVLLRDAAANTGWNRDDKALLDAAARQLGIALRQAADTAELERLSSTDELTGLLNRRAFMAELKTSLGRAEREQRAGALLYIDLDNFKPVNDRFGHDRGDAILQAVSTILQHHARSYDLVARLGGDEFVVWLDGVAPAQADRRCDELVAAVAAAGQDILPPDCQIGASVGIVNLPMGAGVSVDELLTQADHAMYRTKSERKAKRAQTQEAQ
ncbi:MAG: diguanylate cyclase [Alphaproteobacteria bacterium]